MKRGTASKRLSLDLRVENNYLKLSQRRGSYFFAFLSMIIRSILTTSVSKETINVKNANIIMITSYIVIMHHLRSQLKRSVRWVVYLRHDDQG